MGSYRTRTLFEGYVLFMVFLLQAGINGKLLVATLSVIKHKLFWKAIPDIRKILNFYSRMRMNYCGSVFIIDTILLEKVSISTYKYLLFFSAETSMATLSAC